MRKENGTAFRMYKWEFKRAEKQAPCLPKGSWRQILALAAFSSKGKSKHSAKQLKIKVFLMSSNDD